MESPAAGGRGEEDEETEAGVHGALQPAVWLTLQHAPGPGILRGAPDTRTAWSFSQCLDNIKIKKEFLTKKGYTLSIIKYKVSA